MRAAAIDIGTNTVRLLVADYEGGKSFRPVFRQEIITRLGENFSAKGTISEKAMERTLEALTDFKKAITEVGVDKTIAVATSVIREAKNGRDFIEKARGKTGIEVIPISGETEAELSARGALLPVNSEYNQALIFDIGGGSTEFILAQGNKLLRTESIELGVVHLAEEHLYNDPPQKKELAVIEKIIHSKIQKVRQHFQDSSLYPFKPDSRVILIGIAGTPTTLAAIDLKLAEYDREKVINHTLPSERIEEIFQELIRKKATDRLIMPGLQKGREDLIIPGIIIVKEVMGIFGFSVLRVIDSGILEGVVLSIRLPECQFRVFPNDNEMIEKKY